MRTLAEYCLLCGNHSLRDNDLQLIQVGPRLLFCGGFFFWCGCVLWLVGYLVWLFWFEFFCGFVGLVYVGGLGVFGLFGFYFLFVCLEFLWGLIGFFCLFWGFCWGFFSLV